MLPIGASDLHVPCPSFLDLVLLYMAIRRGSLFEKRNSVNICALWAGVGGETREGGVPRRPQRHRDHRGWSRPQRKT